MTDTESTANRKKSGKRRAGFSFVESLILLVVISMVIGGILQVVTFASGMHMSGRQRIDSYLMAASLFAALEAVPASGIENDTAGSVASACVAAGIDPEFVTAPSVTRAGGVVTVSLNVGAGPKLSFSRSYNAYGNETVSDDRVKQP